MEKYKVIAEKITYSLDGYIADHNNRNFGDADGWLRHVRNGWEEFIEAHPDSLNLHEYLQHQQAKVEDLQKRVDVAKYYMKNIFSGEAEVDQCHFGDLVDILDGKIVQELEQALKGGNND